MLSTKIDENKEVAEETSVVFASPPPTTVCFRSRSKPETPPNSPVLGSLKKLGSGNHLSNLSLPSNSSSSSDLDSLPTTISTSLTGTPKSIFSTSSSYGSFGSMPRLNLYSPQASPQASPRSRRHSVPLFEGYEDDQQQIVVKPLAYTPYEQELTVLSLISQEFADAATTTRLPNDFLDRMYCAAEDDKITIAYRLNAPKQIPSRRMSLHIEGQIVASPKETASYTKTIHFENICAGHLARNSCFANSEYNYLDNNNPGAFPDKSILADHLLEYLQKYDSAQIKEVRKFEPLICYSETVNCYSKIDLGNGKSELQPNGRTVDKHYIQEARSLFSIIELQKIEACNFVKIAKNKLFIRDSKNNLCFLDLSKLTPKPPISIDNMYTNSFDAFVDALSSITISATNPTYPENYHAPLFYFPDEKHNPKLYLPVMVQAGNNGFHITGDADPQHHGVRSDMPGMANKTFNGSLDAPENFIVGISLLRARVTSATQKDFLDFISNYKLLNANEPKVLTAIDKFSRYFTPYSLKYYIDYTQISYYRDRFIMLIDRTLERYSGNLKLLSRVGECSIYELIRHVVFDHPLDIHGGEHIHPKSIPEPFGAILICDEGRMYLTANEKSYIMFFMHNRELLKRQHIGVHPYWLGDDLGEDSCATLWLDMLSIQALNQASMGQNDPQRCAYEFYMYWQNLVSSMKKGRSTEEAAFKKINTVISNLNSELSTDSYYSLTKINELINNIYAKYQLEISTLESKLYIEPEPQVTLEFKF